MYAKYVAYVIAAALLFGAGWRVCAWKMGNDIKAEQISNLTDQLGQSKAMVGKLNGSLTDVVAKAQKAADETQVTADNLTSIRTNTNTQMQAIAAKSKELSNEIVKLGLPKCTYTSDYGRVWKAIGENANTGRDYLYGPQSSTTH
jgi:hypothetical protein